MRRYGSNSCGTNGLVQKYIGTSYDNVKLVADNMDMLKKLVSSSDGVKLIFVIDDAADLKLINTDYFRMVRLTQGLKAFEYYTDYKFVVEYDLDGKEQREESGKLKGEWVVVDTVLRGILDNVDENTVVLRNDKKYIFNVLKAQTIIGAEATEDSAGTMKLYLSLGTAEDGTITQKLITNELNKKVNKTSIVPVTKDSTVYTTQVPDAPSLKAAFVNIDALNTKTSTHDSDIQGLKGTDTLHDKEIKALKERDFAKDSQLTAIEVLNTEHTTALSNQETLLNATVEKLETTSATLVKTTKTADNAKKTADSTKITVESLVTAIPAVEQSAKEAKNIAINADTRVTEAITKAEEAGTKASGLDGRVITLENKTDFVDLTINGKKLATEEWSKTQDADDHILGGIGIKEYIRVNGGSGGSGSGGEVVIPKATLTKAGVVKLTEELGDSDSLVLNQKTSSTYARLAADAVLQSPTKAVDWKHKKDVKVNLITGATGHFDSMEMNQAIVRSAAPAPLTQLEFTATDADASGAQAEAGWIKLISTKDKSVVGKVQLPKLAKPGVKDFNAGQLITDVEVGAKLTDALGSKVSVADLTQSITEDKAKAPSNFAVREALKGQDPRQWGVGSPVRLQDGSDLDDLRVSGRYAWGGVEVANNPTGYDWGNVTVYPISNGQGCWQILWGSQSEWYLRSSARGVDPYTPWVRIRHTGNTSIDPNGVLTTRQNTVTLTTKDLAKETGNSHSKVMSQKASTDELNKKVNLDGSNIMTGRLENTTRGEAIKLSNASNSYIGFYNKENGTKLTGWIGKPSENEEMISIAYDGGARLDVRPSSININSDVMVSKNKDAHREIIIKEKDTTASLSIKLANTPSLVVRKPDNETYYNITIPYVSGTMAIEGTTPSFTDVTITSDRRAKENINVIDKPLERLSKLKGSTFNYKDSGNQSGGIIAQDLLEALPEGVDQSDPEQLKVHYNAVIGLLVNAVNELSSRVKKLEDK